MSATSTTTMVMTPLMILQLLLLSCFCTVSLSAASSHKPSSHIAVMGAVYCDICHINNFSKHSYFIQGAEVKIDCKFSALSPETAEQISFSVNRTTNKSGVYSLEIPSIEGIECAEKSELASSCEATLIKSSSSSPLCSVPGFTSSSNVMTIKSKHANLCFYSFSALNFRPKVRNASFCGGRGA